MNKAKKDIEECERQNIRPKHRGLLEVGVNMQEAREHIEKAEYDFKSANDFVNINHSDWAINAFFYSIYHCFLSIVAKFGYESGNQTCTISLIEYLNEQGKIKLDSRFINTFKYATEGEEDNIIDLREKYTYGTKRSVPKEKIDELNLLCNDCLNQTKDIILEN